MFIINAPSENINLGQRLGELTGSSSRLDMLVGFFYFSGMKIMTDPLRTNRDIHLRVLVGMEAGRLCGKIIESASDETGTSSLAVRNDFCNKLRMVMGSEQMDNVQFHDQLDLFVDLLRSGRLEIRKTSEPNHAKLYIFTATDEHGTWRDKIWITGSSNFSEPGLVTQNELNIELSDFGAKEVSAYFEELWKEAVPLTQDEEQRKTILTILKDNSVAASVTPFEAYFLIMKHYLEHQQSRINEARMDRVLKEAGFTRYRYQADAVSQALTKLDQYHGVIIADVVGLGKSIVAGLIAAMRQKRGIIITPPGLMGSKSGDAGGWYEYKHRFKLTNWEIWSRGDMDGLHKMLLHDPDFDMVIVDEAHNFRNENTHDYGCLADVCFNKEVVLLTATPFNNRPSDLLALLHLFSNGHNSPFVPGGNLDEQFRLFSSQYANATRLNKAIARNDRQDIRNSLKKCGISMDDGDAADIRKLREAAGGYGREIAGNIRQIMEKIVIRRNRIDLTTDPDYSPEITTLSTVRPPVEQFFELTADQDSFYDRVISDYFGPDGEFRGAVYRPQEYLRDKAGTDDYQNNLYTMMQRLLVMRFESSFGAFRQSLVNAARMMTGAKEFVDRMGCYLYSRKAMEHIMEFPDDADAIEAMDQTIRNLAETYSRRGKHGRRNTELVYDMNDANFDGRRFKLDLRSDIELLKRVIDEVDRLELLNHDPKCGKLVSVIGDILSCRHPDILTEQSAPKRKVLLFTAYADTLRYIRGIVEKAFPGRVIAIDGANFTGNNARSVKSNFDASFETRNDKFDILLATDKMSEGFNLNRAGVVINYDIPWNPTRVIQRVGRINRIGQKVFDNLYIFNFFPTRKGSTINQNREIAQSKMFAIHEILGEDAQIFSADEEPTAAALYSKITGNTGDGDKTASFYSKLKQKYQQARKFLQENHPEELKRIERLPRRIKTAYTGTPHETLMFLRRGPSFFAIVHDAAEDKISERTLEDAVNSIECGYDTAREPLSAGFWSGGKNDAGAELPGVYKRLENYKPQGAPSQAGGVSDVTLAVSNIQRFQPQMAPDMQNFASDVVTDLISYGSVPRYTVKQLAKCQPGSRNGFGDLMNILTDMKSRRGDDYLRSSRTTAVDNEIVVTVEKH